MSEALSTGQIIPSDVDKALETLREALGKAIRSEQRRDQLTGLPNDQALTAWINDRIVDGLPFWIAFIEVDRFKNLNDKFGYENADAMLLKIAFQLKSAAKDFFCTEPVAFRAHGDEFFLAGCLPDSSEELEHVEQGLEQIRSSISSIRVRFRGIDDPMTCTVSVGWLASTDLLSPVEGQSIDQGLTKQRIQGCLEIAVGTAKVTRNSCVRFEDGLSKHKKAEGRSDCATCRSKFVVIIEHKQRSADDLWCPACGARIPRPHALLIEPESKSLAKLPG